MIKISKQGKIELTIIPKDLINKKYYNILDDVKENGYSKKWKIFNYYFVIIFLRNQLIYYSYIFYYKNFLIFKISDKI